MVSGTAAATECDTIFTFSTVTGNLDPTSGVYTLVAGGGSPTTFYCQPNPIPFMTVSQTVQGTIQGPSCGTTVPNTGPHIGSTTAADTLTIERVPTGETSVSAGWASATGSPTTAMFNATLNTGSGYDFGGRVVTQAQPASQPTTNCQTQSA